MNVDDRACDVTRNHHKACDVTRNYHKACNVMRGTVIFSIDTSACDITSYDVSVYYVMRDVVRT